MTDATLDLGRLRALAERATPGKRRYDPKMACVTTTPEDRAFQPHTDVTGGCDPNDKQAVVDYQFIAALDPATVIALLDRLEWAESDAAMQKKMRRLVEGCYEQSESVVADLKARLAALEARPA